MFEAIETNIAHSHDHGSFVLLDGYSFQSGSLEVRVRGAGASDGLKLSFTDVIGLTMSEDVFGSDGGQITRESMESATTAAKPKGFFWSSSTAPTIQSVFDGVPSPFDDSVKDHKLFLLSLREHELSFVAHKEFKIENMSQDMA